MKVAIGIVVLTAAIWAQAPQPAMHPVPPGAGVITGHVLDAIGRQPLANVALRLTPRGPYATWSPGLTSDPAHRATTNADGAFQFAGLGPVDYDLGASRSAYGESGFGKKRPNGTNAPIALGLDEHLDVDIVMWPMSELRGRVLDEHGRPLVGVAVDARRQVVAGSEPAFTYGSSSSTDARGEYRMDLRISGRFIVCVSPRYGSLPIPPLTPAQQQLVGAPVPLGPHGPLLQGMLIDDEGRNLVQIDPALLAAPLTASGATEAYASTCAPSARVASEATVVEVVPGATVQMADLTMQVTPAFRLSGRLAGPNGPLGETTIQLWSPDAGSRPYGPAAATSLTAPDGRFTFLIVPRGTYRADVQVAHPPSTVTPSASGYPSVYHPDYGSADTNGFWTTDLVDVTRANPLDVVVKVNAGVRVSGVVTLESDGPMTVQDLARAGVALTDGLNPFGGSRGNANAQGQFSVPGVKPGRYGVMVLAPTGWRLVRLARAGHDVTDLPLDVGRDGISDLEVRLTSTPTELSGTVHDAAGQIVRDATVLAFPTDRGAWTPFAETPQRLRTTRAAAGRYAIEALPAGDYYLAAVDDAVMDPWPEQAFLTRMAASATTVSLSPAEHRVANLVIVK